MLVKPLAGLILVIAVSAWRLPSGCADAPYHPYNSSTSKHLQPANDATDTLAHIRDQAEGLKSEREHMNELYAQRAEAEGTQRAQRILDQGKNDAQPYRDVVFRGRARPLQSVRQSVGEEIETDALRQAAIERQQAKAQAERYRQEGRSTEDSMSAVVDSLHSQMESPVIRDGVRLSPANSNLYVRNYVRDH